MADSKISALTALTGANLASGDLFGTVDISDTTMDASGTNKKMTRDELVAGLLKDNGEDRSITSDVTMTTAGTFYDGAAQSLAAGTYLIWAKISFTAISSATRTISYKLWDGTNIFDQGEYTVPGTATAGTITLGAFAKVTLGSTATVKVSGTSTVNGDKIRGASSWKGNALMYLKVA